MSYYVIMNILLGLRLLFITEECNNNKTNFLYYFVNLKNVFDIVRKLNF